MFGKKPTGISLDDDKQDERVLAAIVSEAFTEQRRARRWGTFFKSLTFAYLFIILLLMYPNIRKASSADVPGEAHTAVVRVQGVIAAEEEASAGLLIAGLNKAFENKAAKAIVLAINSPGGSPVQSGYVYDEIRRLKVEYPEKKVYAVIADLGASGAYYIAAAADHIYANQASLVGSIGVTASSFGFVDVIKKLGVERRHFTAGEHKAFLDPFSPLKQDEVAFWESVLASTHQQFIKAVVDGRGDRLDMTDTVSSGLIWNGEQALEMGLIDGLGSVRYVARELVGEEKLKDYTPSPSPLKQALEDLGLAASAKFLQSLGFDRGAIPSLSL